MKLFPDKLFQPWLGRQLVNYIASTVVNSYSYVSTAILQHF